MKAELRKNPSEVGDPQHGSSAFPPTPPGIWWKCTISDAFAENDLVSWKKESWSKIMSGKLWHYTLTWSSAHIESLNSCVIILQHLPQEPACHWFYPRILVFLKQKKPCCGRSWNHQMEKRVEVAKAARTLWSFGPIFFIVYTRKPKIEEQRISQSGRIGQMWGAFPS